MKLTNYAQDHLKQLAYELSDELAAWLVRNRDVFGDFESCFILLLGDEPLSYEEAEQACFLFTNYGFMESETIHVEIPLIYCALMREQGMYRTDITQFVKYGDRR